MIARYIVSGIYLPRTMDITDGIQLNPLNVSPVDSLKCPSTKGINNIHPQIQGNAEKYPSTANRKC